MTFRMIARPAWLVMLFVLNAASAAAAGNDEQVAALIQQGDQLFEQGKQAYAAKNYKPGNEAFSNAFKAYRKAIELDPKSFQAHWKLGDAYFGESGTPRHVEDAIPVYQAALQLKPDSSYVYSQLALCNLSLDRFTQAIAAAEVANQLDPGNAIGEFNLGFIYADMGHDDDARKVHARLLTMDKALAAQLLDKINESLKLSSNVPRPKTFANPKIALVAVKPGTFMLGADDKNAGRSATIKKRFSIGKYAVTQAQWQTVMGDNPSDNKSCGGECPVEKVSWNDAQLFISRLNSLKDGHHYRLPSEAEWEYAYRAGRPIKEYEAGDGYWHSQNSGNKTHPVGQKPANPFGIYDMAGHVEEWCMDYFVKDPAALPTDGNPLLNTQVRKYRSTRGRSYYMNYLGNPATRRTGRLPQETTFHAGFRVAAD